MVEVPMDTLWVRPRDTRNAMRSSILRGVCVCVCVRVQGMRVCEGCEVVRRVRV